MVQHKHLSISSYCKDNIFLNLKKTFLLQGDFYYEIKINGVQKALEKNIIPEIFKNVEASVGGKLLSDSADILIKNFNATHIGGLDGGWGNWSDWVCSAGCEGGSLYKFRLCNSPEPKYGGKSCVGNDSIYENTTEVCNNQTCEGKTIII